MENWERQARTIVDAQITVVWAVFWNVLYDLVNISQSFGEISCFHNQSKGVFFSILNMDEVYL
jgi:hypothetical protein